jgi:hypothetical protein
MCESSEIRYARHMGAPVPKKGVMPIPDTANQVSMNLCMRSATILPARLFRCTPSVWNCRPFLRANSNWPLPGRSRSSAIQSNACPLPAVLLDPRHATMFRSRLMMVLRLGVLPVVLRRLPTEFNSPLDELLPLRFCRSPFSAKHSSRSRSELRPIQAGQSF